MPTDPTQAAYAALGGLGTPAEAMLPSEPRDLAPPPCPEPKREPIDGPLGQWCPICRAKPGQQCDRRKFRKWAPGTFHRNRTAKKEATP